MVYTLKEKNTGEYHLFERQMEEKARCSVIGLSICKKMKENENTQNVFACLKEDDARIELAEIGQKVCGISVSHLYS